MLGVTDRSLWRMRGQIFYDGSCQRMPEPDLCHAFFAVVEVEEHANVTASLQGTVPSTFPQTSQAAEHCSRAAAMQFLGGAQHPQRGPSKSTLLLEPRKYKPLALYLYLINVSPVAIY